MPCTQEEPERLVECMRLWGGGFGLRNGKAHLKPDGVDDVGRCTTFTRFERINNLQADPGGPIEGKHVSLMNWMPLACEAVRADQPTTAVRSPAY